MLDQNADACFYGKAVKMNLSFFRILPRLACAVLISGLITIRVVAQTNNAAPVVGGSVEEPLTLSISDLRATPRVVGKYDDKVYSRWVRQANFIEVLPVGNR
jgi:hypothetical protein